MHRCDYDNYLRGYKIDRVGRVVGIEFHSLIFDEKKKL